MSVKMAKVLALLAMAAVLSSIFTGCLSDALEVDDEAFVLVLGIDEAVGNAVRVTIQYPTYKRGGSGSGILGGGGGDEGGGGVSRREFGEVDGTIVTTIEGPTIVEAMDFFNTSISRRISLAHIKLLVVSESVAKQGIRDYIDQMVRFMETSRIVQLVVCKGKAEDFIRENVTLTGESPSKNMELMILQSENIGLFPRVTLPQFERDSKSPLRSSYTAYAGINDFQNLADGPAASEKVFKWRYFPGELPRQGGVKREFLGTAVFRDYRMVGVLDSLETTFFLLVSRKFQKGFLSVEDMDAPGHAILLRLYYEDSPKIGVKFQGDKAFIDLKLKLSADIGAMRGESNYERIDKLEKLSRHIESVIEEGMKKMIEKVQKEFKADIFGFGQKAAGNFLTIQEWEKYDWDSRFPEAEINVDVTVDVRRTGLIFKSHPLGINATQENR